MNVDTRLFEYGLEPVLQRASWRLEGQKAALARIQTEIRRISDVLIGLRARQAQEFERAVPSSSRSIDPHIWRERVRWLSVLAGSIGEAEEEAKALRSKEGVLIRLCQAARQSLDVLERHREEALAEFVLAQQCRQATEADRDWLTRHRLEGGKAGAKGRAQR